MAGPTVELVGAAELRLGLRRLGAEAADPAIARRGAELVAQAARDRAPVDTGALQATIGVEVALPSAQVVAGSPAVPYAGVHEYGWPERGIVGQHYLEGAADDQADDVTDLYADQVGGLVTDIERMTP